MPYTSKIAQFSRSLPDLATETDSIFRSSLHVLLVEPNECMRQCLTVLLNHYDYNVTCAATACEAIAHASQSAPHAVILSADFHDADDFDLCRQLRMLPDMARSVFLGITGQYFEGMYKFAKAAGFNRYYLKPVLLTTFMTILNSLLFNQFQGPMAMPRLSH